MSITNRIKPKHLELVLQIAQTEKLHLAAQAVAISQPAASRILAELESTLGVDLFERHPTGMTATLAGHTFLRHARVMLTELDTMQTELAQLVEGVSGNVRIGAVTGPALGIVMPAVQRLLDQYPDLKIWVDVAPSLALLRGLEEATYDFVLGRTVPYRDKGNYIFHPAPTEIVSLVVHSSHPLAASPTVDLSDTAPYNWVIQQPGSPIRESVETAFLQRRLPVPSRVLNSSSLLVALSQLAQGDSISPQTEEVANMLTSPQIDARLVALNLDDPIIVAPYFVIQSRQRNLSQAAKRLLDEVLVRI